MNSRTHPDPFSLQGWIDKHRSQLKPPVGNKLIFGEGAEWQVMAIAGPNCRSDFHINEHAELFVQIEGDMLLRICDGGVFRDIVIPEGHVFLLPGNIPHSPQRYPSTLGVVFELQRREGELDGVRWYCQSCNHVVYETFFACRDLGTELAPLIMAYFENEEMRTCRHCGDVDQKPEVVPSYKEALMRHPRSVPDVNGTELIRVDWKTHPMPFSLSGWIEKNCSELSPPIRRKYMMFDRSCEFKLITVSGSQQDSNFHLSPTEEFFWQKSGNLTLKIVVDEKYKEVALSAGDVFLLPVNVPYCFHQSDNSICLVVERERRPDELDCVRWYCTECSEVVSEKSFKSSDLDTQIRQGVVAYGTCKDTRICPSCRAINSWP